MLAVYAAALLGIALFIAITGLEWLGSKSGRLAVIANLLSFGTLLLALVAGIVALAAYSAGTRLPDLHDRMTGRLFLALVPGPASHDRSSRSGRGRTYVTKASLSSALPR